MAAFKNEKNGTWEVSFRITNYRGEKKGIHKRGFKTKKEAQDYESNYKATYSNAIDISVSALCDRYLTDNAPTQRPTTQRNLKMAIKHGIVPYLGDKSVLDLTPSSLLAWRNELICKKNKSYAHTAHRVLIRVLNHAVKYYNLPSNPLKKLPSIKQIKHEMKFWTLTEYQKVSDVAYEVEPTTAVALDILFYCGLRSGELLALTPNDIDLEACTINISKTYHARGISGPPKTRKSARIVDVPRIISGKLANVIKDIPPDQRIWAIEHNTLLSHFYKITEKAGLGRIRLHDLRHSNVSLLIEQQVPVTAIAARLGHETPYITFAYSHLYPESGRKIADKLDALISSSDKDLNP